MSSDRSNRAPSLPPTLEPMGTGPWYTPTEVARRLGIEYSSVLNYARELGDQLQPRRGERNRLYFSEADVEAIRQHHARPRVVGLTLGQIATQLNVPSHRLKAVAEPLKAILPRLDTPRKRLYAPEAIEILRKQLVRSARKAERTNEAAEYWRALAGLRVAARQLGQISQDLRSTYARLRRNPPSVTAYIHTLPGEDWILAQPIGVVVSPLRRTYWRASLLEAKLHGSGRTMDDAVVALQAAIVSALRTHETRRELRALLKNLVRRRRSS